MLGLNITEGESTLHKIGFGGKAKMLRQNQNDYGIIAKKGAKDEKGSRRGLLSQ